MITLDHLQAAFALVDFNPLSAQAQMAPYPRGVLPQYHGTPPRQAGVLALVHPSTDDALHIVLTRRTERLRGHSGQISFPGGQRDPEDSTFIATALRETCEELGLCDQTIAIIGALATVYIPPSHFEVHPTVGYLHSPPRFQPNPDEVAEVLSIPMRDLLDEARKGLEYRDIQGFRVRVPYYQLGGHKVWGATAAMLSELEARLRAVLAQ